MTFAGVFNNVSSPYLDYDTNQMFFGDSAGRIHRVAQRQLDLGGEGHDQLSGVMRHAAAAVAGLRRRPDHRHQRQWQALSDQHHRAAAVYLHCGATGWRRNVGRCGRRTLRADCRRHQRQDSGDHQLRLRLRVSAASASSTLMFAAGEAPTSRSLLGSAAGHLTPTSPAFDDDFWSTNDGNLYAGGGPYRRVPGRICFVCPTLPERWARLPATRP